MSFCFLGTIAGASSLTCNVVFYCMWNTLDNEHAKMSTIPLFASNVLYNDLYTK